MRVTSIDLYANERRILNFNLVVPDPSTPYILKGITGTDAEEITPRYYAQGAETDTKFYDLVLSPREIVLRIGLNPDYRRGYQAGDLRSDILKAISSNRSGIVQLQFLENEDPGAVINGFITKFEGPVSGKEPEVILTVKCPDPLFKAKEITQQIVDSLDTGLPLLIDPVSTAPHGFKMQITFNGPVNPFIIKDASDDWEFRIDYDFIDDDQLFFSSVAGEKYILRVRGGVILHLMDVLAQGSVWPIMFPGENQFEISGTSFEWNEVYWTDTHWGI